MKDNDKLIQDWQAHIRESFGNESRLFEYLSETLNNFYHRYIETTQDKDLTTRELGPKTYGAWGFETSMMEALKSPATGAKQGIIDLAKSVPRSESPSVRYGLWVEIKQLTTDEGELHLTSEINWDFPDFENPEKRLQKKVVFTYDDLAVFRKQLALKLEEVCELFES